MNIVLASGSEIRATMLRAAGVRFTVQTARIDEVALRDAMLAEGAKPRDIADKLAEVKAQKVAARHPDAMTLGADQVLDFEGEPIGKCDTAEDAAALLRRLSGKPHSLHSAAVIFHEGKPVWRHVGHARMKMRTLSDDYIDGYVTRNWQQIRHCAGCYQVEAEGIRLFDGIGTDYHAILGLPLMPILQFLTLRGVLQA